MNIPLFGFVVGVWAFDIIANIGTRCRGNGTFFSVCDTLVAVNLRLDLDLL